MGRSSDGVMHHVDESLSLRLSVNHGNVKIPSHLAI
jgi:hypothetical protein